MMITQTLVVITITTLNALLHASIISATFPNTILPTSMSIQNAFNNVGKPKSSPCSSITPVSALTTQHCESFCSTQTFPQFHLSCRIGYYHAMKCFLRAKLNPPVSGMNCCQQKFQKLMRFDTLHVPHRHAQGQAFIDGCRAHLHWNMVRNPHTEHDPYDADVDSPNLIRMIH